jgi:hypothetical protein
MHPEAHAELRRCSERAGAIGSALLLPHPRQEQRPDQQVSRHLAAWWLKEAFRRGKLQKPDGSPWHTSGGVGPLSEAPSAERCRGRVAGHWDAPSVEPHGATRSLTHTQRLTHLADKAKPGTTEVVAGLDCPSWARTRTLLIQSPPAGATFPDSLLGTGHLPSIGARFPAVVCPVVPG